MNRGTLTALLVAALALAAQGRVRADVEHFPPLSLLPPAEVLDGGERVAEPPDRPAWRGDRLEWRGDTFYLGNDGLYRVLGDGTVKLYDPLIVTVNLMGHERPAQAYVPRRLRSAVAVGDAIWLGSNAFGVLRFRPEKQSWTRFDNTEELTPGKQMSVLYADESYVFAIAGWGYQTPILNVFSQKRQRWIAVDTLPAEYVVSAGITPDGPLIAARHHYGSCLKDGVFEVPPWFETVQVRDRDYILTDETTEPKTEVRLPRAYLEQLFAEAVKGLAAHAATSAHRPARPIQDLPGDHWVYDALRKLRDYRGIPAPDGFYGAYNRYEAGVATVGLLDMGALLEGAKPPAALPEHDDNTVAARLLVELWPEVRVLFEDSERPLDDLLAHWLTELPQDHFLHLTAEAILFPPGGRSRGRGNRPSGSAQPATPRRGTPADHEEDHPS